MTSCRIPMGEMRVGDVVVFKRNGFVSWVLGGILRLFEPKWDGWGWHTGFISHFDTFQGFMVCEALAQGVCTNPLSKYQPENIRAYRWFDVQPDPAKIDKFFQHHYGEKYDILVYPLTAIAYLVRHYWGRPIPRLFDNAWSCWELVYYFADKMGKPIAEDYDFPLITDMLKAFGEM